MALIKGDRALETRKDRARLSVRDPLIESLVEGLGLEGEALAHLRSFSKHCMRQVNHWDVYRRGGLFGARKLSKDDADRLLKRELALIGGDA